MKLKKIFIAPLALVVATTAFATGSIASVSAKPKTDTVVVWVSEDSKTPITTANAGPMVGTTALTATSTYCVIGSHTQKAIDWPTGATLAWHKMSVTYCYNGYAIVGTPYISYHNADSTAYGTSLGISFNITGTSGPYPISSYQWTATGYAQYKQCSFIGGVCRTQSRYVTINPQGSGNYGWAEG